MEFHLDLEGKGEVYRMGHRWLPDQIGFVIATICQGFAAHNSGLKVPTYAEFPDRPWRADPTGGLRPLLSTCREWFPKGELA